MKGSIPKIHNDLGQLNVVNGSSFAEIPDQVRERAHKDGFVFNLLVVGRRGHGSSTLVNSLFSSNLVPKDRKDGIYTTLNEVIEGDVKLTISVTTYHGEDFEKLIHHIESLNEEYFENEQGLNIPFLDKRIHCCLFLTPADKITEKEIAGVQALSTKVNLIPIIAKADIFTVEELREHREKINKIFLDSKVQFYDYGEYDSEHFPMAVIASENIIEENGFVIRGRKYPWGVIDIENHKYSDFKKLQRILIGERFVDLIYETDRVFYSVTRKNLMMKESSGVVKQRLSRIIDQLDKIVDEKYKKIIDDLKAQCASMLAIKTGEMSIEQTTNAITGE